MLKCNKAMSEALSEISITRGISSELNSIAAAGFFESDGCSFLRYFKNMNTNVTSESFEDRTGYECFINSIHVDDFVESFLLGNAIQFIKKLFSSWAHTSPIEILQAVLTADECGATVRLHVVRVGESWIGDDLNEYDSPILVATSDGCELHNLIDHLTESY